MKQYVRAYVSSNGEVKHLCTQETPINFEPCHPAEEDQVTHTVDFVIEHGERFLRARDVMNRVVPTNDFAVSARSGDMTVRGLGESERALTKTPNIAHRILKAEEL